MTIALRIAPILLHVSFVSILSACTAYDFGGTGDYFYEVANPEKPSWNDGIGVVVEKKCGTCHTQSNPWYKPQNVPELPNTQNVVFGLNFISQEAFFSPENKLLPLVKKCIESTCGKDNIPMPPNYATPLSESEKKALLAYITPIIPVVVSSLSDTFKANCSCHGADGKSGFAPKLGTTRYSLDEFKNIISNGIRSMQPQPGYDLSKAESDYSSLYK
jgi:hypothetical protein